MKIAKGDLVRGALELIRISGLTRQAVPEDLGIGLQVADDYAGQLESTLNINYQQPAEYGRSDAADNSGLSVQTSGPFKKLLAVELVTFYGKPIPPSLALIAGEGMRDMENLIVKVGPAGYPGTLPYGSGNEQPYRDRKFYAEAPDNEGADYVYKDDILNWTYDFTDYPNWLIDDTLSAVEWSDVNNGITIGTTSNTDTTATAELTFTKSGGQTLVLRATKTGSTDLLTVTKNFIVLETRRSGYSY